MSGVSKKGRGSKIRRQMLIVYVLALLIPVTTVSGWLLSSAKETLNDYYIQLLETDNRRVKMLLSEMTMRIYEISDEICFSDEFAQLLSLEHESNSDFVAAVNRDDTVEDLHCADAGIAAVYIYTDNPTIKNYKYFWNTTQETAQTEWYQKALESTNAFWTSIDAMSLSGVPNNLCLVRQIPLHDTQYHAVAVLMVSDSYIRSWVDSGSVIDAVSLDDGGIVYSSRKSWYGQQQLMDIDQSVPYFRKSQIVQVEGEDYYAAVSTVNLYMTGSRLYVCTLDNSGVADIRQVLRYWTWVLLLALALAAAIILIFADRFSGRVMLLREQMRRASQQDYELIAGPGGKDELAEAFDDLNVMIRDILRKDAKMYEAELNKQELINKQQLMEYKMLASQINPHYLYNTLETIRMKALTCGDRQVADAIKILGKTLHYVLENNGVAFTTLDRELDHIQNYLAIQRLRFGERINYTLTLGEGVQPQKHAVLPLLLQPVVENAVVHGLETVDGVGRIALQITLERDALQIAVMDNGVGMTAEELQKIRRKLETDAQPDSSVALYNIHRRIRLRYGENYGVILDSTPGEGTCVILRLPA